MMEITLQLLVENCLAGGGYALLFGEKSLVAKYAVSK